MIGLIKRILVLLFLLSCPLLYGQERLQTEMVTVSPALWFRGNVGTTLDADNGVSPWADQSGNAYDVSQGTASRRPVLSRSDNLENLALYSETPTSWSTITGLAFTGNNALAVAGNTIHLAWPGTTGGKNILAGEAILATYDVECGNYRYQAMGEGGDAIWHSVVLDCSDGSLPTKVGTASTATLISGTPPTGRYRVVNSWTATQSPYARPYWGLAKDGGSYRNDTIWNAAGTETGKMYSVWVRSATADATYVATTNYPKYSGKNSKSVLFFDGSTDFLGLVTVAGNDLFTGPTTLYAVLQAPQLDGGTNFIILQNETYLAKGFLWRINGNAVTQYSHLRTNQAGAETARTSTVALTPHAWYVLAIVYDGTTLTHYVNNVAAGSGAVTKAVSGVGNSMTLGATGQTFSGRVAEVFAFNAAHTPAERTAIYRYLQYQWGL